MHQLQEKDLKKERKKKHFVWDIEMGDENNEDEDEGCRLHRGTNGNFASTLRSLRLSIHLLVFFHHDSTGIDEEEVLESKKAMKDQLTCSTSSLDYLAR